MVLEKIVGSQWLIYAVLIIFFLWLTYLTWRIQQTVNSRRRLNAALARDQDIQSVISKILTDIDNLNLQQEKARGFINNNRSLLSKIGRYTAVIRYDAFADVGGKLSFSAALLNEAGDGVIITSIIGRNENRVYAKPVKERTSSYQLSEEEKRAIKAALNREKVKKA